MDSQPISDKLPIGSGADTGTNLLTTMRSLFVCLRPQQWVKNSLVFGGLIFSRSLLQWEVVRLSLFAFAIFCLASSGIYLLNDLCDVEADRNHPIKRLRPLASGKLSVNAARGAMCLLLLASASLALLLRPAFALVLGIYLVLNVAYSLGLKRVVILDVMAISFGFVLRAVAGAVVIGVGASPWLVLCTLMLALLMGFGKRRHELSLLQEEAHNHRQSLDGYSIQFLDLMMTITAGAAVVTYALYTMADETVARFNSHSLVLTIPFVLYGIFRYLFLVHKRMGGGDPARLLVTDAPTLVNLGLWVIVVCFSLYGPRAWHPW
jgi:4-hydroxybenzoate polyprenyltransferase